MGSICNFLASSSIADSIACIACGAPGALYAAALGLLTRTSNPSITKFSISYGASIVMQPGPIGAPAKAPAS